MSAATKDLFRVIITLGKSCLFDGHVPADSKDHARWLMIMKYGKRGAISITVRDVPKAAP
jgi:hypothetical protein